MKLSNILYLYRVRVRTRLVQELFAILGIAVGVALLFASQVANTSLSGSVEQLTAGLVGKSRFQLAARSPQGFDERLLAQVQRLPGVLSAAPLLEAQARLIGPNGHESVDMIGVDPRFAHLGGVLVRHVSARALARQRALAVTAPIAQRIGVGPLQTVNLQIGASTRRSLVGVVLQESDIGALIHSPVMVAPLAYSQRVAGMRGRLTRIFVQPQPGADREVRAGLTRLAAGALNVRPANFDATLFRQAEGPTSQSTELFSAISALVGFLFAFNAMLLTVPQRRNLIADLRLDGYTPWQIVRVLIVDALILGIEGTVVGLLLGELLSHDLLRANPGYLSLAFPVGSQRIVTWQCIVTATGGGMLAACIGVLNPLRDVFAHRPLGARAPRSPSRASVAWASSAGAACLMVTTAILLYGVNSVAIAVVGFLSLIAALVLLLPVLLSAVVSAFDHLHRPIVGVSARIAVIELRSSSTRVRSVAIAATGALAVFGSVAIEGAHHNLQSGLNRAAADLNLVTSLWISPAGTGGTLATVPFQSDLPEQFAHLDGVQRVHIYRGSFLDLGDHRTLVVAPSRSTPRPIPPTQLIQGNLATATARIREGGWIAVSTTIASEFHLHVGQTFQLPAPRPTNFRVAAVTTNFGWPPGAIVLNADDYAQAWSSNAASAYQVDLKPGISPLQGQREVQRVLGKNSSLSVQTAQQRAQSDRSTQHQGLVRLTQIALLVLIAAVLAMSAAMGNMIWQRRPQLAGMKVDGYDQGELWRSLVWESMLLLGAGCSIGAAFGLYGQLLLSHALASVTGFPVNFSIGGLVALGSFTLVTAVAVAIVAVPGYLAARVQPALQS
jgi:putative ABC transport system permease protein